MQEFSSISVSTYEPGSLAERLTEKSADGWDVVSIVTTGSTVTAYLARSTDGTGGNADATAAAPVAATVTTDEAAADDATESASDEPAAAATSDGSGWAMTTGAAAAAGTPEADEPAAATAAISTPATEPATEPAAEPAVSPTPEPASEPAAAASAAPAGWYADPSSRYELRYWDGSTWTEHVSRAGQQYTDPPVA